MAPGPWGVETEIPTPGLVWGWDGTALRAPARQAVPRAGPRPPPNAGWGASAQHRQRVMLVLAQAESPGREGPVVSRHRSPAANCHGVYSAPVNGIYGRHRYRGVPIPQGRHWVWGRSVSCQGHSPALGSPEALACLGCDPRTLAGSEEGAGEENVAGDGLGRRAECTSRSAAWRRRVRRRARPFFSGW